MSRTGTNGHASAEFDEYVTAQADMFRETLEQLREIVRQIAAGN